MNVRGVNCRFKSVTFIIGYIKPIDLFSQYIGQSLFFNGYQINSKYRTRAIIIAYIHRYLFKICANICIIKRCNAL